MTIRLVLLSFALTLVTCTSLPTGGRRPAGEVSCPSQVQLPEHFTAEHIRRLAADPAVKTVEDMLGCLTRDLKLKTLLLHTSFAAQNSDSKNPRVLLLAGEKRNVDGIFSVNSGEPQLNQNNSIEFMFNDKKADEIELYDIDFEEGHAVMSPPNPETCLNCHGVDSRVPVGGPKAIFDRDPWSRVVHAGSDFNPQADASGNGFCLNRRRLHYGIEKQALQAFKNKPRYQSLVNLPKTDADEVDFIARDLNSRRIAKLISQTPDYQEFKWSIFAVASSCVEKDSDVFSRAQIARMTDTHTLDKGAVEARNSFELDQFVLKKETTRWQESLVIDEPNISLLEDVKHDRAVTVGLPNVETGGQCKKPFDRHEGEKNPAAKAQPITMMDRFEKDSDAVGGDREIARFRYIFESRGMLISDWNTQLLPGYGRGPGMLLKYLLEHEAKNGADYAELKDAVSRPQIEACPRLLKLASRRFR